MDSKMTTRSSIVMRTEADQLMGDILKGSIKHQETVGTMKMIIDLQEEKIQLLLSHMSKLFNTLEHAFDSDESIFVNDELSEIVDAIKSAGIIIPYMQKKRQYWIEKMETRINDLPY
jgi:predicted sugar kinase